MFVSHPHPARPLSPSPQDGDSLTMFIPALVQELANRDTAYEAARMIMGMAHSAWAQNDPGPRDKILAAGALPPLVALLGTRSTAAVQEVAAGAIFFLAYDNAENIIKIAAAGSIPPLVTLLGSRSTEAVQAAAAGALWHLSVNADNKIMIAAAGAIPPLVALLSSEITTAGRIATVRALRNLVANGDIRVKAVDAGAISPMVALLSVQSTEGVQEAAGEALISLAVDANNKARVALAAAIPPLVAMLGAQSKESMQKVAAITLCSLTKDTDNQTRVAAAAAIPSLVAQLGAAHIPLGVAGVQEIAAQALGQLALNGVAIKSDPRVLPSLSKLHSTSPSAAVREAAKWSLNILNTGNVPLAARGPRSNNANKVIAAEDKEEEAAKSGVAAANSALVPNASVAAASSSSTAASQQLPPRPRKSCWSCGATGVPLKKCSVCAVAAYCGAACQKADWKAHKGQCAGLKAGAGCSDA